MKKIISVLLVFALLVALAPSVFATSDAQYYNALSYLAALATTGEKRTYDYKLEFPLTSEVVLQLYYDTLNDGIDFCLEETAEHDTFHKLSSLCFSNGYWRTSEGVTGYYLHEGDIGENYKSCIGDYSFGPEGFTGTSGLTFNVGYTGAREDKAANLADAILGVNDILTFAEAILETGGYSVKDLGFTSYKGHVTHRWEHNPTYTAPTCTESGSEIRICYVCGVENKKTIPALGHDLAGITAELAPTATQPGYQEGDCKTCGVKNARNIIPAIFTDTVATAWYAPHVEYVYNNGIMNGVNSSSFAPGKSMTRGMVAAVLYRVAGSPEVEGEMPFSDIREGSYYEKAVLWAAKNGIVTGYADGTFLPTREITREQLATILYRYTNTLDVEMNEGAELTAFPDEGDTANYAREALSWAVGEGLVTGVKTNGATYLRPKNNATRAQFATIIARFMAMTAEKAPEDAQEQQPVR